MKSDFGTTTKGEHATLYTLKNKKGMEIAVSDYGAVLVRFWFLTGMAIWLMWFLVMMM